MNEKESVVETHVDRLMALLEQKQYISVAAAAKELGVDKEIVEEWARFLEEEGLLKIKYQFTTPYLQWVAGANKQSAANGSEPSSQKSEIPRVEKTKTYVNVPLSQLIQQAKEQFNTKNYEEGKESYRLVQKAMAQLPQKYLAEKHEADDQLIAMHKGFSEVFDKENAEKIRKHSKHIHLSLKEGKKALGSGNLDRAIQTYNLMKQKYLELPEGYFSEKKTVTENILNFYQDLSVHQQKVLTKDMEFKSQKIYDELNKVMSMLSDKRFDDANTRYEEVKQLYDSLPMGFLEEKVALQQRMLSVYRDVILNKKEQSTSDVYKKTLQINELVEDIQSSVRQNQLTRAVEQYKEAKQIYASIPKGFLRNEALIRQNILRSYKLLLNAQHADAKNVMKHGGKQVDRHLQAIDHYTIKGKLDMAFQHYKEVVEEYNKLPSGISTDKAKLRNAVYERYYNLISKSDVVELGQMDEYVQGKYFKLLELLVTAHKVIDSEEYALLRDLYLNIYTTYHELPVSVVKKRTMLGSEVQQVYGLVKLYDATQELDRLAQQQRIRELHHKIDEIKNAVEAIDNPQDQKLLDYINLRVKEYGKYYQRRAVRDQEVHAPARSNLVEHDREMVIGSLIKAKKEAALHELSSNNLKAAIPHLKTLLELDPNDMEARYMLESARTQLNYR